MKFFQMLFLQKSGLFILQKSGQNYFFVEFKSPHFCKMKIQKSGRESRLISVYALYLCSITYHTYGPLHFMPMVHRWGC